MDSYGGSAPSGQSFNPLSFIRQPQVILRVVGILCAIIVFACIADKVVVHGECAYYYDDNACNYGIAIGVISFTASIAFLIMDFLFARLSNAQMRKYMVLADLVFSVVWSFMWFVGFCYLTDRWRKTLDKYSVPSDIKNNAQAAIAFSFFSIVVWVALAVLAFFRYRKGPGSSFAEDTEGTGTAADPGYSSFPGQPDLSESYQQPPFTEKSEPPQYQPPTY
ncbi:synaptogyrin-2-like [Corticium candelabrum]|uniref:synaptogyrin-2-like n=1 Tax=Corticium candelabrum TaxID=121492 RepID=UPI002E331011|nr:synaptogyrin-2-like [Corticium candelabrum]